MLFNSLEFLIFLPTLFCLYWFIFKKNLRLQNLLLLIGSYFFYGWWDWRFLFLIFFSTLIDYWVGIGIENSTSKSLRKCYLLVSIIFNLSILGFFKYFNFFIDSWVNLLLAFGFYQKSTWTLNIILPVGISFYTFQTMSYAFDIYYGKVKPTKDFISFASFVSFFPQLVAGPIERASNLLPQILNKRIFSYERSLQGLRLIIWGMFKKVVIADSLSPHVDIIFNNYTSFNGGVLLLGLIYFSFQIYCDFSGYSDIAIGTAKLFGFEIMSNFKFPYFSRNISEFWRKWHISLSTWFRDYLYIPLGGSKKGNWSSIRNIFVIFIVSGLWHGANLTFIIWGLIHALLYLPLFLFGNNRKHIKSIVSQNKYFPSIKEFLQIIFTFFLIMISWVFFRSETTIDAINYLNIIITNFGIPNHHRFIFIYVLWIIVFDWLLREDERLEYKQKTINYIFDWFLILAIYLSFDNQIAKEFIYFQF